MMGALHLSLIEPKMVLGRQVASDPRGGAVVSALLEDTHLPMALVDLEGRYQFVSDAKARLLNATPERLVGRTVGEVLGADLGQERLELIARVAASVRPLLVESTLFGAPTRTVMRSIPAALDSPPMVLIVHHVGFASASVLPDRSRYELVRSRFAAPIPVAQLTQREREVLVMIAQGLTQAQIADRLHRSVKTIEWHRASLGKKLGVGTAVELAHIAIQNGLCPLSGPSAGARSESPTASGTSPRSGEQSPARAS